MAGLGPEIGHSRQFCQSSCQACVYYRRVKGLATNVLVITSDEAVIERLAKEENGSVAVRFARNSYDASAIIQDFRPAFAVIDEELLATSETKLLDSLASDHRVPGLRMILAAAPGARGRRRGGEKNNLIVNVVEKPLSLREIVDVIDRFPVDSLPSADSRLESGVGKEER
jgi:DNA-binding NtrC family response regulator